MKQGKRLAFLVFNMLLLAGGLAVGFYTYQAAGRYLSGNILLITPTRGDVQFYPEDRENIKDIFPDGTLVSRSHMTISHGDRQTAASVIFCDAGYFSVYFMDFIEGGPWDAAEDDIPLIILSESLAWYLFGGRDVTGLMVRAGDGFYRIAGVVRQDWEHMAWLTQRNRPVNITAIYIRSHAYNPVDTPAYARYLLEDRLFRRLPDYAIVDINRYVESIGIRHRILLYGVWLYILILLINILKKTPRKYEINDLKKAVPLLAGICMCIFALTGVNRIILWLPHLSDPHLSVFASLSNVGLLPPEIYLSYGLRQVGQLNSYGNYAWIIGAVGLVHLIFSK